MPTLTLETPLFTRAEMVRFGSFWVPTPASGRRIIRGLTLEQVRGYERKGVFDSYKLKQHQRNGRVFAIWKPRGNRATAMYSALDLLVARLIAWMLADGIPSKRIVQTIRGGEGYLGVRITMTTLNSAAIVFVDGGQGLSVSADEERVYLEDIRRAWLKRGRVLRGSDVQRFPLAWLCSSLQDGGGGFFEVLERHRQRKPRVTYHSHDVDRAEIAVREAYL